MESNFLIYGEASVGNPNLMEEFTTISSQPPSVLLQPSMIDLDDSLNIDADLYTIDLDMTNFDDLTQVDDLISTARDLDDMTDMILACSESSESLETSVRQVEQLGSVAPSEVLDQVRPKKRGRKPKVKTGEPCLPRKPKTYEMGPFEDQELERRRKNAINAKQHRSLTKHKLTNIEHTLAEIMQERDELKRKLEALKLNSVFLNQKIQEHGNVASTPIIS